MFLSARARGRRQVRVIYAFLQLPPSLYEGLAPGLGHPQAYGASAGGELSATDAVRPPPPPSPPPPPLVLIGHAASLTPY